MRCLMACLVLLAAQIAACETYISLSAPASTDVCSVMAYLITYGNAGTETVNDVTIRFRLPNGAAFLSASGDGIRAGNEVNWTIPSLGSGVSGGFQVNVVANSSVAQLVADDCKIFSPSMTVAAAPVTTAVTGQSTIFNLGEAGNFAGVALDGTAGFTVSGIYSADGEPHAYTFTPGGGYTDIGSPPIQDSETSFAFAINDGGAVAGIAEPIENVGPNLQPTRVGRAFVYAGGQVTYLNSTTPNNVYLNPTFGYIALSSTAHALNNTGMIAGSCEVPQQDGGTDTHACVWDLGQPKELGTLEFGNFSFARGINDDGVVVGYAASNTANGIPTAFRAFIWRGGGAIEALPTLGGNHGEALDINNRGEIVGYSETADGSPRGFIYSDALGIRELPETAYSINDQGLIAAGTVMIQNGFPVPLARLIPESCSGYSLSARHINNNGQISGIGDRGGFILTPAPDQPPVLTSPNSMPASLTSTGGTLLLTVTATDDRFLAAGTATILRPDGGVDTVNLVRENSSNLEPSQQYSGSYTVPPNPGGLQTYIIRFSVQDSGLNQSAVAEISVTVLSASNTGADADGDGIPDTNDPDDDNDGVPDADEAAQGTNPRNPNSHPGGSADFDLDGQADQVDADDDNDGFSDAAESAAGTDPYIASSNPGGSSDIDGDGLVNLDDPDDDGDGFLDEIEIALNTSPLNVASTPFGGAPAGAPVPLALAKLAVKLNFAKDRSDSLQLSGTLNVPAGFAVAGQVVTVVVGGVIKTLALNEKGASPAGQNDSFKLRVKAAKGVVEAQSAKFSAKFKSGDFAQLLADEGLTDADLKDSPRPLPVTILFNSQLLQTTQAQFYTATAGKGGKTNQPR